MRMREIFPNSHCAGGSKNNAGASSRRREPWPLISIAELSIFGRYYLCFCDISQDLPLYRPGKHLSKNINCWKLSITEQPGFSYWYYVNAVAIVTLNPLLVLFEIIGDYRGINITPVIAGAFEKAVYRTQAKSVVEDNLIRIQRGRYLYWCPNNDTTPSL